ncbi:MAG: hypothetical protein K0U86_12000 [Planctomycetes bacterium]|nr:hypothetical protein [Planctomycetota bacterium]MCH9725607.1 hypothetical protein [Planctomycetota bacterium]MCH9777661.1 hypothetical protein [Planctomycetota bacterium]MDF1746166.1 hypothetical protein [Gimesia sp.]
MNLNKTERSDNACFLKPEASSSQSATISMSNQTKSVIQIVTDSTLSTPSKDRNFSAQAETQDNEEEEPVYSLKEKVILWLASFTAAGWVISFLFHSTLLTVMAIVIVGGLPGNDDISTLLNLDDEENIVLNGPLDTRIDEETGGKTTEFNIMQPVKTMVGENESTLKEIEEDILSLLGKGEGEDDGDGKGGGGGEFKFKPKGNAVTAGSFTAWTVPKDPDLNEDYLIFIQVKLPYTYKSKRYRASDLKGIVLGTDNHRQAIPWDVRWPNSTFSSNAVGDINPVKKGGYLIVKKRFAQLIVKVPGSTIPATRDTIKIESKILKEKRTLEIEF